MELDLGDGYRIRPWRRGDEPALVRYANNPKVAGKLRDAFPHPYTPADAQAWIDRAARQDPETSYAVAAAEEAIGGIGLLLGSDVFRRSAELGYWLGEPFWGRGITTRAVAAFCHWAFARFDLLRIEAGVFAGNPASERVLAKCGFAFEGRLRQAVTKGGRALDVLLYARVKE
jgi:ribosomal-protein-alanine N-acetyltransferase